jgi:hypothetical protein
MFTKIDYANMPGTGTQISHILEVNMQSLGRDANDRYSEKFVFGIAS